MNTTSSRYDQIADFYEVFAPDAYDDPLTAALLDLIGAVSGMHLLDMACGHGRLSRELARRGAHVVGVDLSSVLLDKALAREQAEPLGIAYVHADAASSHALDGELFDGITCHFGLSDIDDLEGAAVTVTRVLQPGGFFTFSILHPCFPGWEGMGASPSWPPGRGYFTEEWWLADGPPGGLRPIVGANHRMLSTYLNLFARFGLVLEEVAEPCPPQAWIDVAPDVGAVPIYWAARYRKP